MSFQIGVAGRKKKLTTSPLVSLANASSSALLSAPSVTELKRMVFD